MDIIRALAEELGEPRQKVQAAVGLIDEGNTIPFIARYRKEATGGLTDEVLRKLDERLRYLRSLEERKELVLRTIEEQGKLTPELKAAIEEASTLVAVEDLYRPYKPKRRTRATVAKEKGLEPLAEKILEQDAACPLTELAAAYISEEKGVATAEEALAGASDILAERLGDEAACRKTIREATAKYGVVVSGPKDEDPEGTYKMYLDFSENAAGIAGHRVLALNRGEKENKLTVKLEIPEDPMVAFLSKRLIRKKNPYTTPFLENVAKDAYERLIAPSVEREIRAALTEKAEDGAIEVFGKNLEQLLMQPPIVGQVTLGWDPAFRTGCKISVVDGNGKVLDHLVIFPTAPQNHVAESKQIIKSLIRKYGVTLIALGNGTASRESEQIIVEILKEIPEKVSYVIVSEAGASVYSASKLATEEFPDLDVGARSSISLARRLQDPLSELVKIDPKSIGVGQYQHDMDQKKLGEALSGVVEDAVNKVGVDLNTASPSLLEYVSGINKTVAKNIVSFREESGSFTDRRQLLKVPKLGPKAYEQCAGFLRVRGGKHPLDNTAVHPESYEAAEALMKALGFTEEDLRNGGLKGISKKVADKEAMAEKLGIGVPTLNDILAELEKPGRDPREEMPKPVLRSDVLEMKDLKPGMILKGTVRNVIDFGVFVDIGVHQDGLVHISRICDRFIKHPLEAVKVGQVVEVQVLEVDEKRKRIALTMKIKR